MSKGSKGDIVNDSFSKQIALPKEVAERYKKYCRVTRMCLTEPLRVMVLESVPQLHNTEKLEEIVIKTRNQDRNAEYERIYIRLPNQVLDEIDKFCFFFKLNGKRCHFFYFMIEEKLLQKIKEVLRDE